ncbi:hypothetical protein M0813_23672 [Anaeramoeba flamelloides]|uniref:Reverse transcriptase domain-containing protein n=1 Tax=Anaeramoeba flamelloides TaxID=1746091 RepID=A0ABQ8Y9Y4_9EUKA|nr:hypothetical protein M0813_23672 [Anaeramoeba flamelloides]
MKEKAVLDFDKIYHYKNTSNKITEEYLSFINTIKMIYDRWLSNFDLLILNFIKKRYITFIHKKGDEGNISNYRPISINSSLARIFLKLINIELSYIWRFIDKKQFGYRPKYGTIIPVIYFIKKFKKYTNKFKKDPNKKVFIVTIDIMIYFDAVPHILIRKCSKLFIKNKILLNFIFNFYLGSGHGIYQGDPLSPIIFAIVSHFLINEIRKFAEHTQMYADDLILIMIGDINDINSRLDKIFQVIKNFGMNPNDSKTLKKLKLKEILYLGIILEKKAHLKQNELKALETYNRYSRFFNSYAISNKLKLLFFKAIILSQLTYGLEVFTFNKDEIKSLNSWIMSKVKFFLKVQFGSPSKVVRFEAKIEDITITLNKRKWKLIQKLKNLKLEKLLTEIEFIETNDINWLLGNYNQLKKEISKNRIKELLSVDESDPHKNWKTRKYFNIITNQYIIQKTNLNILIRIQQGTDKRMYFCGEIEDIDHFLWKCTKYKESRDKWLSKQKDNLQLNKIKKDQNSTLLLAKINNPEIYYNLVKFIKECLDIRGSVDKGGD